MGLLPTSCFGAFSSLNNRVVDDRCDDDDVGGTHWDLYAGDGSGFADDPVAWAVPGDRYPTAQPFRVLGAGWCTSDADEVEPLATVMDLDGDGAPRYLAKREAAISAWYGDGMDETTIIDLVV